MPISRSCVGKYADREGVLVVGHNPNLFQFLGRIITGNGGAGIRMRKGSIARIDMDQPSAAAAVAHRSAHGARHLRQRGKELAPEDLAEVAGLFAQRPQLQLRACAPRLQLQINPLGIDLRRTRSTSLARSWFSATASRSSTTARCTFLCSSAGMLRSARSPGCGRLLPR